MVIVAIGHMANGLPVRADGSELIRPHVGLFHQLPGARCEFLAKLHIESREIFGARLGRRHDGQQGVTERLGIIHVAVGDELDAHFQAAAIDFDKSGIDTVAARAAHQSNEFPSASHNCYAHLGLLEATRDRSCDHCNVSHGMSTYGRALAIVSRFGDNAAMDAPELDLIGRPLVMGILNVTPDSFSDGGRFMDLGSAVGHAEQMIRDGADIIDVGGESTRPGSQAVSASDQIKRTQPVIASIRERQAQIPISIDTQSAEVAFAALDAGATIVNDISALRADSNMACRVAEAGAYAVLMHMQGMPRTMQQNPRYDDVVGEIEAFLEERIELAVSNGIRRERIIIDPGIGFGKTVEHNLEILANLRRFTAIGPMLLGTSRKSLFAGLLGIDKVEERLTGTIVTNTIGLLAGVRILRVHDIKEARQVVTISEEIRRATRPGTRVS